MPVFRLKIQSCHVTELFALRVLSRPLALNELEHLGNLSKLSKLPFGVVLRL
jgi:hypothetical protein